MKKLKTYFNWSTGKDASLALYHLQKDGRYEIDRLITTVNAHHNRVSMHGLRRELLEGQAKAMGLPLTTIELPEAPSMEEYNDQMERVVQELQSEGYSHSGFGDIYLEDLRGLQGKPIGTLWYSMLLSTLGKKFKRAYFGVHPFGI